MNGLERTPSGGQVIIRLNQGKENYEFIITDQGNGFNEESLKNGFKLFFKKIIVDRAVIKHIMVRLLYKFQSSTD